MKSVSRVVLQYLILMIHSAVWTVQDMARTWQFFSHIPHCQRNRQHQLNEMNDVQVGGGERWWGRSSRLWPRWTATTTLRGPDPAAGLASALSLRRSLNKICGTTIFCRYTLRLRMANQQDIFLDRELSACIFFQKIGSINYFCFQQLVSNSIEKSDGKTGS